MAARRTGTAAFTNTLLARGVPESDLTHVEYSADLASRLRQKFPQARVQKNGLGFHIFNACQRHDHSRPTNGGVLTQWCPRVPLARPLVGDEAPLSNWKAREMLGFKEQHNWRDELKALASATG
jgi:hypothetical protein